VSKEWVLNAAFNRWQLNRPKYVGKVSEAIRACAPKTLDEWKDYYFNEVSRKHAPSKWTPLAQDMRSQLEEIGRRLYVKISENLRSEVESVTEQDCIEYVYKVVIERTYEGYQTERQTIYGQLAKELGIEVHPAPDEWDRKYNVDFYIETKGKYIGIQIKPMSYSEMHEAHNWQERMRTSHERFEREVGGKVFIIFSSKASQNSKTKVILNTEVVKQIADEIDKIEASS